MSSHTTSTSTLERTARSEDVLAQAYKDFGKSLHNRSCFKVSDRALADDLVQTTFLKAWEFLVQSGKIDSMKAFLFHVLNNLIVDEYRKKKSSSLDLMVENGFQVAIDDSQTLVNEMDGRTATMLIPLLPEKYRNVVSMRYIDDMQLKEIANLTQQSENTAVVQIRRGIHKLAILCRVEEEKKKRDAKKSKTYTSNPRNATSVSQV